MATPKPKPQQVHRQPRPMNPMGRPGMAPSKVDRDRANTQEKLRTSGVLGKGRVEEDGSRSYPAGSRVGRRLPRRVAGR